MDITFPTLVYKTPGDHQLPGGTYKYMQATNEEQFNELLEHGWFATIPEAIAKQHANFKEEIANEEEPITRDEIVNMANELGISFRPNISDKKLLERINEKLGE